MRALLLFVGVAAAAADLLPGPPRRRRARRTPLVAIPAAAATSGAARLSVLNCTEHWIGQELDHFSSEDSGSGNNPTWQQRTFVYDGFVPAGGAEVVFFYVGNEADVTLYVNASGLMWERAEEFGALLVWSEHRYYGESQPFGSVEQSVANKTYLSVEQALADHAKAAGSVRSAYNVPTSAATVAFGGSYGGMLATWLRLTRPDAVDGAVAASAPVLSFEAEVPPCDATFYAKGVSFDVSPAAGASAACSPALSRAFSGGGGSGVDDDSLPALGATAEGRATLTEGLRLCEGSLRNASDAGWDAAFWLDDAMSYMAMGNYPYESSYILNGDGTLPPFPVRAACDFFDDYYAGRDADGDDGGGGGDDGKEEQMAWLNAVADFAGVYYNHSGDVGSCFNVAQPVNPESEIVNELWNWQYCTQIFQLFGQSGPPGDVFWASPWDPQASAAECHAQYGDNATGAFAGSDVLWATQTYGPNVARWVERWNASNIVWSNGEYDPWAGGGVARNVSAESTGLWAISIPAAAHHLDLMWSDPGDTDAVRRARDFEMGQVRHWIDAKKEVHDSQILQAAQKWVRQRQHAH